MIAMLLFIILGIGCILAGATIAFRANAKFLALLLGCFGLFCLAATIIMVLALAHFGEVPRH